MPARYRNLSGTPVRVYTIAGGFLCHRSTDNITPLKRVVVQLALLSQREIQSTGSSIITCGCLLASKKAD